MGSLVLEVLTKPDHLPIAHAQWRASLVSLCPHSISGFFTLVSQRLKNWGKYRWVCNASADRIIIIIIIRVDIKSFICHMACTNYTQDEW